MSTPKRLRAQVARLRELHGEPEPPVTTDPFEMVIWENVAYLVEDERRRAVFEHLREEVGLEPEVLLGVPAPALAGLIASGGMLPEHRAEKVHKAARIAHEIGTDELRRLARSGAGRKQLRRFPGIGEPGADKILLFARGARSLAPDSNALRVLVRLGYGEESEDYPRQYRSAAAAVAPLLPDDFALLIEAHQLLRRHGQEICKRNDPRCELCPLTRECRWYRARGGGARGRSPRRRPPA